MFTKKDLLKDFTDKIGENSKLCIYGSNKVAEKIFDYLQEKRKDIEIKFFADSKKGGELKSVPIYYGKNLSKYKDEVDSIIVASFSSRYFLELILRRMGFKNIYLLDKDLFETLNCSKSKSWDVNKSASVFKTRKERELYKFISKVRQDRVKYLPIINDYFNKNYKERYMADSMPKEHYLDFVNKDAIKNVIDGGGFDGFTSVLFADAFKNVENIYMFEPCYNSFKTDLVDAVINEDKRIKIIPKGLWNEDTTLNFREETQATLGSAIVDAKPGVTRPHKIISIETTSIDSFAISENVKIDYIKLDVENAEMTVLKGAEKVLLNQRPQLAISIYHSDEHFYNIPLYLQSLLKDYEFRFAHYSGRYVESVMYAIPKELARKN